MQIDKNITSYLVNEDTSISESLSILNEKKQKILFLVNRYNCIAGAFADGDFRRWVLSTSDLNLSKPIKDIANKTFIFAHENSSERDLAQLFSERISVIPLVDDELRVTAIAKAGRKSFSIGPFNLNQRAKSLVIAEIGNNHNGSLDEAKRLVDSAIESGADCVKFQMRDIESLYINSGKADDISADLGTQYVLDLLSRFQLADHEFECIFEYCREKNVPVLCTPFDKVSADKLDSMGIEAYKVASADLTNHELLLHLIKKNKPLIISTGMSTEDEIISALQLLQENNANFVLLHCNSTYPAPFEDINLSYLQRLQTLTNNIVGYSGHERGINVAFAAVALGAKIIEKHFTHDKNQEGNDHKVSLLPSEFKKMVDGIREIEQSLGDSETRKISQGEMMNRETLGKSIVANKAIKRGEIIHESMLSIMSPGKGIAPYYKRDLIGRVAKRDLLPNDFFYLSDLSYNTVTPRHYKFSNRFGMPVRYHDFESMIKNTNLDFVEFHLSYKDLDFDIEGFFNNKSYPLDCLVHAPELFSGDHLLDLCSEDESYRNRSIEEMQRVIGIANQLKKHFKNSSDNILVVVNVGGFSKTGFVTPEEKELRFSILEDSLSKLDTLGVELIPQTMPPYPWHFGGQQYHNLFMWPDEIVAWCKKHNSRICLDVSHTALACNFMDISLEESIDKLAPYTAHLHIADASGTKQEGLQIGEGDINFTSLFHIMKSKMPSAYWLPEIWQGHKNNGEGFWIAFDKLEALTKI